MNSKDVKWLSPRIKDNPWTATETNSSAEWRTGRSASGSGIKTPALFLTPAGSTWRIRTGEGQQDDPRGCSKETVISLYKQALSQSPQPFHDAISLYVWCWQEQWILEPLSPLCDWEQIIGIILFNSLITSFNLLIPLHSLTHSHSHSHRHTHRNTTQP